MKICIKFKASWISGKVLTCSLHIWNASNIFQDICLGSTKHMFQNFNIWFPLCNRVYVCMCMHIQGVGFCKVLFEGYTLGGKRCLIVLEGFSFSLSFRFSKLPIKMFILHDIWDFGSSYWNTNLSSITMHHAHAQPVWYVHTGYRYLKITRRSLGTEHVHTCGHAAFVVGWTLT